MLDTVADTVADTVGDAEAETVETTLSTVRLTQKADDIVKRRTLYAAGAGLIPIPLVDIATLLGVQVIMIRDIARLYNVDFKEQRVRSIITTLVGDLGAFGVMGTVITGVKAIPIVGTILGGFTASVTGAAATYALGKVFTQHFDQGGTLLNFDPVKSRKFFQESYEEGKLFVEDLSETDVEVKEKSGWGKMFSNKVKNVGNVGELSELRQKNDDLKQMIAKLQESVDALKK